MNKNMKKLFLIAALMVAVGIKAQKFEKENDIPALPQVIEQAINKMVNKQ